MAITVRERRPPGESSTAGAVRLEPGTTKNYEGRTFPLTVELRALLEAAHTDAVQRKLGRIIPDVFHRNGKRFGTSAARGRRLAPPPANQIASRTTSAAARSATSFAPASPSAWR
jgi:hypothetical protein